MLSPVGRIFSFVNTLRSFRSEMVNELSQKAQFIITTFGPDLLKYGDKFYGITYRNKVSQIRSVTRDEALEFVEDNDAQNQAGQGQTSATTTGAAATAAAPS